MDFSLGPARRAIAISYGGGDQTLTAPGRGIYISSAGNLVVWLVNGAAATTFTGLLAGTIYPIQVKKIVQSGSSAAGLVLY